MKNLIFCIIIISYNIFFYAYANTSPQESDVCQRDKAIVKAIEDATSKKCPNISSKDLLSITHLTIQSIRDLKPNTFKGLTNLSSLRFTISYPRNPNDYLLTTIAKNAFSGLSNLKKLFIDENNITKIETYTFEELINLEQLQLINSLISSIAPGSFSKLSKLKILNLGNALKLKSLEGNTFNGLTNLQYLYLDFSKIEEIHATTFAGLTNLKELDLSWSQSLSSIALNSFSHLENLNELTIGDSKIATISTETFAGLYNLEKLKLLSNQLLSTIQPHSFKDLTKLKILDLSHSKSLTSLAANTFKGLTNLDDLALYDTALNSIYPNVFEDLINLEILSMRLLNKNAPSEIRAGLGSKCKLSSNLKIYYLPIEFQDPSSTYYCQTTQNIHLSYIWEPDVDSLMLSSYSLYDSRWIQQMEEIIPLIQSSLPKFWNHNNSLLNFYFNQMPLFSGNISELQLVRQLAVDVCALEARFCDTRQRIHAYPGSTELHETRKLLKILKSENSPANVINATTKMESLLSFLVASTIDLNFWQKNLPSNFKYILKKLEHMPVSKELRLRVYSNLAIKTRLLMEQMDESTIKSHGHFAAIFYTQLVKEVKKNIGEIKVYQNKDKVLLSLIELGYAERLLTQQQVSTLKKLVLRSDYDSMLIKFTSWAVERVNFDLGGTAKDPESRFFDFYNAIIRTSILNEVEKAINSL